MRARIVLSTLRYQQVFGHKPRGYGLWYFCLPGGTTLSHSGTYSVAARAVTAQVRRRSQDGVVQLQVCA
jgi:hypothetical protein